MLRFAAPALTALALAAPVQALDLSAMSDGERDAFRAEVRAYLLENPEVIFEAVAVMEERQADAQTHADFTLVQTNHEAIFNDGFSWVGGNPEGDITLVEFMDYRCGYCRRATPEVAKLLEEDGNIRLIVKEFPILGEASLISSRFAIATKHLAGAEAYEAVHNALMEFSGDPDEVALIRLAEGLGLDGKAVMSLMDSDAVNAEIAKTRELAQRLQITGTPTFVLQDEMLRGYLPGEQMAAMIAEKRAQD
ncbi:DsbA family protein [Pontibaca salina]|uniref:DsbA family protein n=1 Tax=Pontibaca salina TaxID=2795731 RepID=A0A934LYN8_9RHOB|nr:DsbA family protein [Pontibaca salina]MBI6629982.1 DsbA family protein [Pontibaca salina]